MISRLLKWGMGVLALASVMINTTAQAQVMPNGRLPTAQTWTAVPSAPAPARTPGGNVDPGVVVLADLPPPGGIPRAASSSNIGADSPVKSREWVLEQYPELGLDGYYRIVDANRDLCDEGYDIRNQLVIGDQQMANAELEYSAIMQIYNALPGDVKRGTAVMTIAQAASSGALCLLSGGLYCIAAIVVGIGNIFTSAVNKKLQLANIRLSLAILNHARATATMTRTWVRMGALWVDMAMRYCTRYMPDMGGTSLEGTFSSQLPPLRPQDGYGVRDSWDSEPPARYDYPRYRGRY